MSSAIISEVIKRAGNRCEYCLMHQSLQGATFHIEHVIPLCRNGSSEFDNLALACPSCNLKKSDRVEIQVENSGKLIPLFNPRQQSWNDHFAWNDFKLIAKSEVGQVTIVAFDLNHERRQRIREAEQRFNLFPPNVTHP